MPRSCSRVRRAARTPRVANVQALVRFSSNHFRHSPLTRGRTWREAHHHRHRRHRRSSASITDALHCSVWFPIREEPLRGLWTREVMIRSLPKDADHTDPHTRSGQLIADETSLVRIAPETPCSSVSRPRKVCIAVMHRPSVYYTHYTASVRQVQSNRLK
jgi:hypothetical protein